jgi:hypothetical protein
MIFGFPLLTLLNKSTKQEDIALALLDCGRLQTSGYHPLGSCRNEWKEAIFCSDGQEG